MVEESNCYVCLESTVEPFALHPLPCECKGDMKVHLSCLSRVIKRKRVCSICKTRYKLAYLPTKDGKELIIKRLKDGDIVEYTVDESGEKDGLYLLMDSSGGIIVAQHYEHGIRNGPHYEYYPSGAIKTYCICIENRIHGTYREWYEDGTLKELSYYSKGLKEGRSTIWKKQKGRRVEYVDSYLHGIKC
jgi:antitoxin component YwqK of YwqJK toxin-antitoxin module